MKKIIHTTKAPEPIGPYNQAILANGFLYASGQIAINADSGELINDSIEAETHQVMQNLKAVLEAVGMEFTHVVKTSIFLSDMDSFSKVNEVYGTYFTQNEPARETVEVSRLPKDVNVEISLVAFMD